MVKMVNFMVCIFYHNKNSQGDAGCLPPLPPRYITVCGADVTGTGRGFCCSCLFSPLLALSSSSVLCQGRPQALLAFQK